MAIHVMPAGGPYGSGVAHNGMQLIRNESTSDSLVGMLGPLSGGSPHVGLQGPRAAGHGGGLEDPAVRLQGSGQKRAYWDGPTVEDGPDEGDEGGEECSAGGSQLEKKRRLTFDQVRSLEENFGMENKLEPERKMQLAKELGLRPRQVAVWFQNRRARWKTKQLERDYETLAQDYKRLKADYDLVLGEKNSLRGELQRLTGSAEARSSPTVVVGLPNKETAETSGSSNSSHVLDAESPRTVDSSSLSPTSSHREQFPEQYHPSSPEFTPESCFMVPDVHDAAVKLEDGSVAVGSAGVFNDVDQSCNYFLPLQLQDQVGALPWWEWPEIAR